MFTELLALVIGQNAAESLRGSKDSRDLLPQEQADAFSGLVAAVLAGFGFLIALSAILVGLLAEPAVGFAALAVVAGIGFGCSFAGNYFGRRAPHVTRRFPGMAKFAVVTSAAGMVLAVASLVIAAAGVVL